jgi:hypothetical protein
MVPVGCGKCIECKKQKSRNWQVRLQEDIRVNKNAKFITYTFSEHELQKLDNEIKGLSGYDRDNEICKIAIRKYTERWRKKYGKTLRHWLVTELGHQNTERVHMHGLIWLEKKPEDETKEYEIYSSEFKGMKLTWKEYNKEQKKDIGEKWGYGKIWIGGYVSAKTINYIVKYVNKVDASHKTYNSKIFTSHGIGSEYVNRRDSKRNKYKKDETIETYKTREGVELALPVYYRNKIYNEEQREALWLEKLDKEERYVCGVKVDISQSEEEYYKLLEMMRQKNKRLGYGDDAKNWELKKYENERRNLKKLERITKLYGRVGAVA